MKDYIHGLVTSNRLVGYKLSHFLSRKTQSSGPICFVVEPVNEFHEIIVSGCSRDIWYYNVIVAIVCTCI